MNQIHVLLHINGKAIQLNADLVTISFQWLERNYLSYVFLIPAIINIYNNLKIIFTDDRRGGYVGWVIFPWFCRNSEFGGYNRKGKENVKL